MSTTPIDLVAAWDGAATNVRAALAMFAPGSTVGMELVADLMTPPGRACRSCGLELVDVRLGPTLRSPRVLASAHSHLARRVRVAISDGLHASDAEREAIHHPGHTRRAVLEAIVQDQHRVAGLLRDYAALQ